MVNVPLLRISPFFLICRLKSKLLDEHVLRHVWLVCLQWQQKNYGEAFWQKLVPEAKRAEEKEQNANWKRIWTVDRGLEKVSLTFLCWDGWIYSSFVYYKLSTDQTNSWKLDFCSFSFFVLVLFLFIFKVWLRFPAHQIVIPHTFSVFLSHLF